jgi:hypothetical protein
MLKSQLKLKCVSNSVVECQRETLEVGGAIPSCRTIIIPVKRTSIPAAGANLLLVSLAGERLPLEQKTEVRILDEQPTNIPGSSNGRISGLEPEDIGSTPIPGSTRSERQCSYVECSLMAKRQPVTLYTRVRFPSLTPFSV